MDLDDSRKIKRQSQHFLLDYLHKIDTLKNSK